MDINDLINRARQGEDVTAELMEKSVSVPSWDELDKQYNPTKHPVMDKILYPDVVIYQERETGKDEFGNPILSNVAVGTEKVSRVTYDLQALAVKRTVELCFGIPVKRVYKPQNDKQAEIAKYLENIFQRTRIDSVNIDRGRKLFASCEVFTLWYAVPLDNNIYGFNSRLKMRCATYSPMQGDELYPLFDETGDLVAFSIKYRRKVKDQYITYFDTYTSDTHIRWSNTDNPKMTVDVVEDITIGKIPGVYCYRPLPAWENKSDLVEEMEWAMSREGNYLRSNSRPILAAFASESIEYGKTPATDQAFKDVVQFPNGSRLEYVTWQQAIDNLRFYVGELKSAFFTQLQLPDWSYENMKTSPMSGEARKQLFIDCHLKVKDESGRLLEMFDREVNVVKAFLKLMLDPSYAADIDALPVTNVITPYVITDEKDAVNLLMTKNGNKPVMSQRESIIALGESEDVDKTLAEIKQDEMADALGGMAI